MSHTLPQSSASVTLELSARQIDDFRRDGYLSLDALTDAAEIADLLADCDALFAQPSGFRAGDRLELSGRAAGPALPQIVNPERYAPRLVQGAAYRNAQALAQRLLGPECVPTGNHAILKPARTGAETPWHQDEAYWDPRCDHDAISVWLALQPVTVDNGCMQFVPGSHRGPVLPHELIDADAHGLRLRDPFASSQVIACALPAGGATVHAGRTLHYAGANKTAAPRRALVFGFGRAPIPRATPHDYPWQRPEWYAAGH